MRSYRQHLLLVLASTSGLSACGPLREGSLRSDLTADICEGGSEFQVTTGIDSPLQPDYVAHVESQWPPRNSAGSDPDFEENWRRDNVYVISSEGECKPTEGCDPQTPPETAWTDGWGGFEHIVYVQDGETKTAGSPEEVIAFFGQVNTPQEAAFLAKLQGYHLPCDGDVNYTQEGEDFVFYAETGSTCGGNLHGHLLTVSADGTVTEDKDKIVKRGQMGCQIGRLPSSEVSMSRLRAQDLGEYFGEIARLESVSVAAFHEIAEQLQEAGAPDSLIAWARKCAQEEQQHAIVTDSLARRFGGKRSIPEVRPRPNTSLYALAAENVVEGLTREAFGGLIATHQALHAEDQEVRSAMRQIALDEICHAEFSIALHEWLQTQLTHAERKELVALHERSIRSFREGLNEPLPPHLLAAAGIPAQETSLRLFDGFFEKAVC